MTALRDKLFRVCPKTGRIVGVRQPQGWKRLFFPLVGAAALIWFLVRVVPKPSRAAYPCQRVAMPLASGFVVWLAGIATSTIAFRGARHSFRQARLVSGALAVLIALGGVGWAVLSQQSTSYAGSPPERVEYAPHPPNQPIGTAKGLMPGRVVWVQDPSVTDWTGPNSGQLWYNAINQTVASSMVSQSLRSYANAASDAEAWNAIFTNFNGGAAGYQPGEKIFIKINLTTSNYGSSCADANYNQLYQPSGNCWGIFDYSIGPSPQLMVALLDQLVNVVGVAQADITIGDSTGLFVNHLYNPLHNAFPNVKYMDKRGTLGRTLAALSTTPLYWSSSEANGKTQDYLLSAEASAKYMINLAILKTHDRNGITVTAKNNYGSLYRTPTTSGYYDLHGRLPLQGTWGQAASLGQYRPLVDLNGHTGMGGKTVLFLVDGIFGGWNWLSTPTKWNMAPINDDWPSSFFLSMDQVAIDSVSFDLLSQQWPDLALANEGVQDYLHEMALANNPPSGTFYDPEHDGVAMVSQGVHEHWNNPVEKKYSRNLGTGNGIELVTVSNAPAPAATVCGAQTLLFVANSTTLNPQDQEVVNHLRAAGYTVIVASHTAVQSTDAVGKDLVLISNSVTSTNISTKFTNVTVPVIAWEFDLFDDLALTGTSSGTNFGSAGGQNSVTITNASHPLAAGLTGTVMVTGANRTFGWGKPPATADVVANFASGDTARAAVFAYETGRTMVGMPAPARRVGFFAAEGDVFTTDGWKLFDAAVKWAVKCSSASGLVLVNGDTGQDIMPLSDGSTIDLAAMPTENLNIRATVDPATVGSMAFAYDGNSLYRTDNTAPYTLDGAALGEASLDWTPGLGQHTLAVTPFSSADRGGRAGASLTITFNVVRQPLAVTLAGFEAEARDGAVLVSWETANELDNLGFNLWRGTSSGQPDVQLNAVLIPSRGQGSSGGFTYTWEDRAGLAPGTTYYYWLENVSASGPAQRHGPISATYQEPTAVALAQFSAGGGQAVAVGWWIPATASIPAVLAVMWLSRRQRSA